MTALRLPAPRAPLFGREIKISAATMWAIFWIGAGSFIPLLFLQYVGEEGTSTIAAQEMHASGDFLRTTIYGQNTGRPGLYGWLILAVTRVIGEQHVLIAARLIAVSSTLLLGLTLAWLVRRLFGDRVLAAFAAAVFLSGDVLLYRGWLAYADPLFSLLTFGAMAALWVAVEQRRRELFFLAALGLIGSFPDQGGHRLFLLRRLRAGPALAQPQPRIPVFAVVDSGARRCHRIPLRLVLRDRRRHRGLGDARPGLVQRRARQRVRCRSVRQTLCRLSVSNISVSAADQRGRALRPAVEGDCAGDVSPERGADRASRRRHQHPALLGCAGEQPAIPAADLSVPRVGDGLCGPPCRSADGRPVGEGADRDRCRRLRGGFGRLSGLRALFPRQLRQRGAGDHGARRRAADLRHRQNIDRPEHRGEHQCPAPAGTTGDTAASRIRVRRRPDRTAGPRHRRGRNELHAGPRCRRFANALPLVPRQRLFP